MPISDAASPSATAPFPAGPGGAAAERGRETRERLLDAAEALFAERGFEGTSLRAVTQAAGTSVSAANYHFGSKRELLRESLRRRVGPPNARRLDLLDALERTGTTPPVEAILDAFLRPLFEERAARPEAQQEVRFVAARLYAEHPELVNEIKRELFGPVVERFLPALGRALPEQSPAAIAVGFQFAVGVMVHVMSGNLREAPGVAELGEARLPDDEALLRHMIAFLATGLQAATGGKS